MCFLKWPSFLQSSYLPSQVFWPCWNLELLELHLELLQWNTCRPTTVPISPTPRKQNQKILSLVPKLNECIIIHQLYSRKVKTLGDTLCLGIYLIYLNRFNIFLISSVFVRYIPFLSFIVLIFAWKFPLVSLIFWMRSLVFPILLFSSISLYWLLRFSYLSLLFFETLH